MKTMKFYQRAVKKWLFLCFGKEISEDKTERIDRFIEEALELSQSLGYSKERALSLVDYVYARTSGEPSQELGGVMVTLAALCAPHGLDLEESAQAELDRINHPDIVKKIRDKQKTKPTGSALPQ